MPDKAIGVKFQGGDTVMAAEAAINRILEGNQGSQFLGSIAIPPSCYDCTPNRNIMTPRDEGVIVVIRTPDARPESPPASELPV
jgi:hypothetical protein